MAVLGELLVQSIRLAHEFHQGVGARLFHRLQPLLQRLLKAEVWEMPDGSRFEVDPNSYIDLLLITGRFEPQLLSEISSFLEKGDWAVDIGANVGGATVRMARRCGESGGVLAYEPSPQVIEQLERNVDLNDLNNVKIVRVAAGDRHGDVEFFLPTHENLGTASTVPRSATSDGRRLNVEVEPVDSRWDALGRPDVKFVKVDIEGGEYGALRGMRQMLDECSPTVVLENEPTLLRGNGKELSDIAELLRGLGYDYGYVFGQNIHLPIGKICDGVIDTCTTDVLFL